jgi:hypothetical protein
MASVWKDFLIQEDIILLLYTCSSAVQFNVYRCASLIKHHAIKTYGGVEVLLHHS